MKFFFLRIRLSNAKIIEIKCSSWIGLSVIKRENFKKALQQSQRIKNSSAPLVPTLSSQRKNKENPIQNKEKENINRKNWFINLLQDRTEE